jgi:hypothetical protein
MTAFWGYPPAAQVNLTDSLIKLGCGPSDTRAAVVAAHELPLVHGTWRRLWASALAMLRSVGLCSHDQRLGTTDQCKTPKKLVVCQPLATLHLTPIGETWRTT